MAYDDQYLYASGRFYDSRPEGIRINSLYRDRWSGDDDFAPFVDGFNDNETGLWFGTTPAGIRIDQSISEDARVYNESWNAGRDLATTVTPEEWFVRPAPRLPPAVGPLAALRRVAPPFRRGAGLLRPVPPGGRELTAPSSG